jgi:type I restriction enzyme S subunit
MSMDAIAKMPTYETYKDSDNDYSGKVPVEWGLVPIRAIFEERNEKNDGPVTDHILSVTRDRGVIPYDEKGAIGNNKSEDIERYKLVYENDLVINKMNVVIGSLGLSRYFGALSQVYIVLRPKSNQFSIRYYAYMFHNEPFYKSLIRYCTGIMELRESLNKDQFKQLYLPFPTLEEQTLIASFLDQKTAQIDEAIAIKEKQIALLKERKQIIIQKAVTQGLNPDVPMKDSGVDWIGEIPAHWELRANRSLYAERVEAGQEGLPLLMVSIHSGVSREEVSSEENIRGRVRIEDKTKYIIVKPGDIVFNMMRAWQGGIGAVATEGMVSPAYIVAKPKADIIAEFFEYQYRCPEFIQQMDRYSKGITDFRKRLYWDSFKQLLTVVPPKDEQLKIIDQIQKLSESTEQTINLFQNQITKLKEYKTTLINSAVTGKIRITPEMVA